MLISHTATTKKVNNEGKYDLLSNVRRSYTWRYSMCSKLLHSWAKMGRPHAPLLIWAHSHPSQQWAAIIDYYHETMGCSLIIFLCLLMLYLMQARPHDDSHLPSIYSHSHVVSTECDSVSHQLKLQVTAYPVWNSYHMDSLGCLLTEDMHEGA